MVSVSLHLKTWKVNVGLWEGCFTGYRADQVVTNGIVAGDRSQFTHQHKQKGYKPYRSNKFHERKKNPRCTVKQLAVSKKDAVQILR